MRADPIAPSEACAEGRVEYLPLSRIQESTTNPRRTVRDAHFEGLVFSVRTVGVLQPVLVRPVQGDKPRATPGAQYELVAGHRRLAAAREALLPNIPAFIRDLSDEAALEVQITENLQRADLHALEEARGYQQLLAMKYDIARISARIGRSVKYVYDRVKLLQLVPAVQELFLADRITPGHAIILARLKPADQERAIDLGDEYGGYGNRGGALFVEEHTLFTDDEDDEFQELQEKDPYHGMKTRSVRELQAWVDEHVRFDHAAADVPDLFPETHEVVSQAKEQREKIIPITHEHHIQKDARDDKRVWGPRAWKPASEKPCEYSITGVIVVGPGRGDAMKVCVSKEKCAVHWSEWQKERAKAAKKTTTKGGEKKEDSWARENRLAKERQARESIEQERRKKARPLALKAVAEKIAKAPAGANGVLAEILASQIAGRGVTAAIPRGKTAEDLVRHLAYLIVAAHSDVYQWEWERFTKAAKALGVDVTRIVNEAAPVQTSAKAAAPARPAKKKGGKKAKR